MRTTGILALAVLLGLLVAVFVLRTDAEEPARPAPPPQSIDQARVEQFIRKMIESQGGGRVIVEPTRYPSPIPGLEEVRFVIEGAGVRRPGVVYLAGDTLIIGQLLNLTTEQNLTRQRLGQPENITYALDQFDLKGRVPRGGDQAVLTLVEFSDFQCPYCKQLHGTLQSLMAKYPGQVRLYYKHFPLENHPLAYPMALAAECARLQKPDTFWSLHDQLFADQYTGADTAVLMTRLRAWAGGSGVDGNRLVTCVEQREPAGRVDADLAEGRGLGITGTPAVIANGEFFVGAVPLAAFERFLAPAKK
jgi:protein-disulfide isomerase